MPTPTTSRFGTLLREFREQAGLSEGQLASLLNVKVSLIKEREAEQSKPQFTASRNVAMRWGESALDSASIGELAELLGLLVGKQTIVAERFPQLASAVNRIRARLLQDFPEEPKPYRKSILAQLAAGVMTIYQEIALRENVQQPKHATQAPLPTGEEEAQELSTEYLPDTGDSGIISPPMAPKEVDLGDHLTNHISELQSQAKLSPETKQQPSHYPHENVVFHVTQLQAEALGRQRTKKDSGKSYEVVATLRDAADRTGVTDDDILTTGDIEAEYHINRKLVHEYTKRGRKGQPHLTPLDVRLARGGGNSQLLFRREDIERIVANPPKSGRPPRKELDLQLSEASDRLMTLAEASEMFGIPVGTLANYLSDGILTRRGRQRSPAPGGGKVLVDPAEVKSLPRRSRGRPKKNPEAPEQQTEQKLITLKEAVVTHGVGYETLRSWYRGGFLPEKGREVFGTHGGGKILVAEEDVLRLKNQPPARGRPPFKSPK